ARLLSIEFLLSAGEVREFRLEFGLLLGERLLLRIEPGLAIGKALVRVPFRLGGPDRRAGLRRKMGIRGGQQERRPVDVLAREMSARQEGEDDVLALACGEHGYFNEG